MNPWAAEELDGAAAAQASAAHNDASAMTAAYRRAEPYPRAGRSTQFGSVEARPPASGALLPTTRWGGESAFMPEACDTLAGPLHGKVMISPAEAALREARAAWTVLCVDDDPNILAALSRLLRTAGYRTVTAAGGAQALQVLSREAVQLVIADMRMPGMDGDRLLARVKADWPEATRLLLAGYADVDAALVAVDAGTSARHLTKPWNDAELLIAVRDAFDRQALEQDHRRLALLATQQADELRHLQSGIDERIARRVEVLSQATERLTRNYLASIRMFSTLMETRGGNASGHSSRVAELARRTAGVLGMGTMQIQEVHLAATLHDIGLIGLPTDILSRPVARLTSDEQQRYRRHPMLGEQALVALDDMHGVATLVRSHHERFDGDGFPDRLAGEQIPMGARIVAVADVYDDLRIGAPWAPPMDMPQALAVLARGRGSQFDPRVLDAFGAAVAESAGA